MTPLDIAKLAAAALSDKKGEEIQVLKVEDLTIIASYFVLATGLSSTQVRALANEVEFQLSQHGIEPARVEGVDKSGWMLLDYGSVIVHVFSEQAREFYSLERLWADAKSVPVEL